MGTERVILLVFTMLFGMAWGSFLNVVAWRIPRGESIVKPRSRCCLCGADIKWHDNLPVLSWLILRGKCRNCGGRFSARYALVELLTGLLFAALMLILGPSWMFLRGVVFVSLLILTVLTDLDHWIVLDSVSLGGIAVGLGFSLVPGGVGFLPSLGAACGAFLLFYLIRMVSRLILRKKPGYTIPPEGYEDESTEFQGGMGWGDIKLVAMMGAFLGPSSTAVALFLAFFTGAVTGVIIILAGRNRRIPIPFGPFLALGGIVSAFVGAELWHLYISVGMGL